MDSSNAEKAWEEFVDSLELDFAVGWAKRRMHLYVGFKAGYASRDAEVATLIEVIEASSRTYEELEAEQATRDAEVGVLREQLAAAEAVIEKVRDAWNDDTGWVEFGESVGAILPVAPSSVLAAVKADAWDEGYGDDLEATTPRTNPYRTGDTNA